jgi:tellurite resistance protein TerC
MPVLRGLRKLGVALVGTTVLAVGLLLLVLPGPAFLVIPAGLTILACEFAWARRWLDHVQQHANRAVRSLRRDGDTRS